MKRVITANTSRETSPVVAEYIERISGIFYNSGYDITGYGTEDGGIVLETNYRGSDSDMMPTIKLAAKVTDDGRIYTNTELSFPVLTFGEDDYYTTTHHWLVKWEEIGRYLSQLHEYVFYFGSGEE